MKKIFNLILASSVALGFAACNNDRAQNEPANDEATMLRLIVSEAQTRAGDQVDANGVGAESDVKDGLFMTVSVDQQLSAATPSTFSPTGTGVEKGWESEVVKYTGKTGKQNATLVLNYPEGAGRITETDQTIGISDLSKLTSKTGFTMSAITSKEVNIRPEINQKTLVKDENSNLFSFEVERVVSKVQFSLPDETVALASELKGTMSDLRYAVAGSADKVYLFKDHAGDRTMTDKKYNNFKSAIHENAEASEGNPRAGVTKVSDKNLVAHFADSDKDNWEKLYSLELVKGDNYDSKSQAHGIFFLENSLKKDVNGKGQLHFNDITYVKVYAKFAPTEVNKYDASQKKWSTEPVYNEGTVNEYEVEVTKEYYEKALKNEKLKERVSTRKDGDPVKDRYYLKVQDQAGTFYVGENGQYYYDLISARAAKNPTSKKYVGGKMVWMTPANNQIEGADEAAYTKYADTRRNNIYSLSLTSIDAIGENYDPIDPDDPNVEKPNDNPDEPVIDPIKPVDPAEIYIQVKATILKWNLVHRGVVLK